MGDASTQQYVAFLFPIANRQSLKLTQDLRRASKTLHPSSPRPPPPLSLYDLHGRDAPRLQENRRRVLHA